MDSIFMVALEDNQAITGQQDSLSLSSGDHTCLYKMSFPSIQLFTFSVWTDMVDRHCIALVFNRIQLTLPMLLAGCLLFCCSKCTLLLPIH